MANAQEFYKLANSYLKNTTYKIDSYDDVLQELVTDAYSAYQKYYDENKGTLATFCYKCFESKMASMYRSNNTQKRQGEQHCISLDSIVKYDRDYDGRDIYILDAIRDMKYDDDIYVRHNLVYDEFIEKIYSQCGELLYKYLNGKTQDELAKEYNVSQTMICRKLKNEVAKLRKLCIKYGMIDGGINE